jgi:hypothetical protein
MLGVTTRGCPAQITIATHAAIWPIERRPPGVLHLFRGTPPNLSGLNVVIRVFAGCVAGHGFLRKI